MDLISLIVGLVLLGLAFWVIRTLSGAFGIPAPIVTVLQVIVVVFAVLWLLQAFGLWSGGPSIRLR
jgi:hypothetical protein